MTDDLHVYDEETGGGYRWAAVLALLVCALFLVVFWWTVLWQLGVTWHGHAL